VVDRVLETKLIQQNRIGLETGTIAFRNAGLFFIHAAKVQPVRGKLSPDRSTMRFCAQHHFVDEIALLQPRAICFLGRKAGVAAETVLGDAIGEVPQKAAIQRNGQKVWEGWAAVTVQPLRGTKKGKGRERVARVIEKIRDVLKPSDALSPAATRASPKSKDS
jgi:hypothetical protein